MKISCFCLPTQLIHGAKIFTQIFGVAGARTHFCAYRMQKQVYCTLYYMDKQRYFLCFVIINYFPVVFLFILTLKLAQFPEVWKLIQVLQNIGANHLWHAFDTQHLKDPVAKFMVPDQGIQLTPAQSFHAGLPAYISSLAGRYDNPMSELTLSPQPGSMNLATANQQMALYACQLLTAGGSGRMGIAAYAMVISTEQAEC